MEVDRCCQSGQPDHALATVHIVHRPVHLRGSRAGSMPCRALNRLEMQLLQQYPLILHPAVVGSEGGMIG